MKTILQTLISAIKYLIQVADNLKNSKFQIPKSNFDMFHWYFIGIWCLAFGTCSSSRFIRNLSCLLLLLPIITFGQNRTYIGAELGPKFDVYQYADNGDGLYTKPFLFSPIYGFTIGQGLNKTFMFETGFYVNNYGESYRIKGDNGYSSSNALIAYQIPLRLKSRLNLTKQRLHIVATVGYTFGINSEYGSYGSGSSFSTSSHPEYNDSTRTQDLSSYSLQKTYGLIETGLSLDYTFKNLTTVYIAANYLTGLNKIVETHVRYWINDEPEQRGTVFSNGNYYSITIGARYPISDFWTKKDE